MTTHTHAQQRSYEGRRTPLLTVDGVAESLAISRRSVYELVQTGELTGLRVVGRLRFPLGEVEAFLDRQARK